MEKINLTVEEQNALDQFSKNGHPETKLVRDIIVYHMNQLRDIRNIDEKGNMGLQTLASQKAFALLEEVFGMIFSDISTSFDKGTEKKKISPWR